MPTYRASDADINVVKAAYAAAKPLTTNDTVLLALFEAGLVESNFHNPAKATDHDSLGYLQQRPSQGWPNPTDIPTATKSFVTKAVANLKANPGYTPGQLAQSVQRSAYPDRYAQAIDAANQLLNQMKGLTTGGGGGGLGSYDPNPTLPVPGVTDGSNPLGVITDAINTGLGPLKAIGKLSDQLFKIFIPSNFVRVASGVAGGLFILYGIYLLSREVRNA